MKIYLETMGCQMNRLDSELVLGLLRSAGHEAVEDPAGADVVLYNTCSVRDHAEGKVLSRVGEDLLKRKSGRPIVGVLGCMAQRWGRRLQKRFAALDIVCAPGQLAHLAAMIDTAAAGKPTCRLDPARLGKDDASEPADYDALDLSRGDAIAATGPSAMVRVMHGCDRFCTYCIVPYVRGPQQSRNWRDIVAETQKLVDAGCSEITLLGQTVNSYRWSEDGAAVRFSDLLAKVSAVGGLRRLRFVTSHPVEFGDDILQAMRDLPNLCPYIHCPAQSGSDAMLAAMNRHYTRSQYDDLIDRARAIVPEVVLAGDFIVGFPGESEADHEASADLIRRCRYKNCFVFKYSPRPGTAAAKRLTDDVPEEVKRRRNNELLAVQEQIGQAHHQAYVGKTVEVLVTAQAPRADKQPTPPPPGQTQLSARTSGDHIVVFFGPADLIGTYQQARVIRADNLTLFAELAKD